jgi:hypothetical protein
VQDAVVAVGPEDWQAPFAQPAAQVFCDTTTAQPALWPHVVTVLLSLQ